jgi:hypothetical protein
MALAALMALAMLIAHLRLQFVVGVIPELGVLALGVLALEEAAVGVKM